MIIKGEELLEMESEKIVVDGEHESEKERSRKEGVAAEAMQRVSDRSGRKLLSVSGR